MMLLDHAISGYFCWFDLAATHADRARDFYGQLFGWEASNQSANGGSFTRFRCAGLDVGSLYQLSGTQLRSGVPSHWTPYIRILHLEETLARAAECGGRVVVRPFVVDRVARIALIQDAVGALVGLWEPLAEPAVIDCHG